MMVRLNLPRSGLLEQAAPEDAEGSPLTFAVMCKCHFNYLKVLSENKNKSGSGFGVDHRIPKN